MVTNKRFALRWSLSLLLVIVAQLCHASSSVEWGKHSSRQELATFVEYWQEPAKRSDIERVRSLADSAWTRNASDSISLGYHDSGYWFRVRIDNKTSREAVTFLEIGYPVLDHIEVYSSSSTGNAEPIMLGDKQAFYDRPIHHRNFVIPLTLPASEATTVLIRVQTTSSVQVPLTLWDRDAFYAAEQSRTMFEGIYYGIVLVMILYNLFVFMAVGERSFLHYVGYITAMPLFLASLHGVAFQYLWPEATWWNDQSIIVFLNLAVLFGGTFSIRFINVSRRNHPSLNRWTVGVISAAGMLAAAGLLVPYKYLILPTILLASVGCSTMLFLSIVRWLRNDPAARYYTFAWVFMLSGGILLALSKFTMLPRNLLTENGTQVGSALGVILLSIALADRLNSEKKRAYEAQQKLLGEERKARIAQEQSLQVQREANSLLEERVQERTRDLESLNEQLLELSATDALTGLKNRGHFDREFSAAVVHAYRYGEPLSLLVLDIDHFKKFNDTHGHLIGDDCLKMVAQGIRKFVTRPQDLAARYGGEEFVVLLPETPEEGAVKVAERIRTDIEKTGFRVSDEMLNLTVSVGVCSVFPARADATKDIFRIADEALYEAKAGGRNRVVAGKASDQAEAVSGSPA
ncbi:sensor domain-containing diguanylate cyclase [Marinobacter nitratireducens]|uniref:sensor domain-containing diguanylate cyclase n=1 Tax=Marinobacter nitratireducens TaxID=1137280 RepID=UPI0005629A2D|nr:diguanylate cyclase [Marinobacter nitratireducens]